MSVSVRRLSHLLAVSALLAALGASAADPVASFDAGVAAYRDGDAAAALSAFQEAQAAGLDSAPLQFNLGLCYYRLERYPEARSAFERLAQFPGYRHIVDFHLGLIAARQGERDRAEEMFLGVERDAPQAAMRERARIARLRMEGAADGAGAEASGYLLLGAGYDSNPALLDESLQPAGGDSATTELFGALDLPLAVAPEAVTWLQGGAYSRSYTDESGLDQDGVFAGLTREVARRRYALDLSASRLDGERFTDTLAASVGSGPRPGGTGTALRVQLARIGAAGLYRHLEGWRLRAELERRASAGLRSSIQLEVNDRADLETGSEFFSHSPVRARLALALERGAGSWSLQWSARYRHSRYLDPNRFFDGGQLREQRRAENLLQGGLRARRPLGGSFNWLVEYQYSRNTSTIDAFDYDRHLVLTGLEWLPQAR